MQRITRPVRPSKFRMNTTTAGAARGPRPSLRTTARTCGSIIAARTCGEVIAANGNAGMAAPMASAPRRARRANLLPQATAVVRRMFRSRRCLTQRFLKLIRHRHLPMHRLLRGGLSRGGSPAAKFTRPGLVTGIFGFFSPTTEPVVLIPAGTDAVRALAVVLPRALAVNGEERRLRRTGDGMPQNWLR
jgi:hypothetical protein